MESPQDHLPTPCCPTLPVPTCEFGWCLLLSELHVLYHRPIDACSLDWPPSSRHANHPAQQRRCSSIPDDESLQTRSSDHLCNGLTHPDVLTFFDLDKVCRWSDLFGLSSARDLHCVLALAHKSVCLELSPRCRLSRKWCWNATRAFHCLSRPSHMHDAPPNSPDSWSCRVSHLSPTT